ncbi:MAG: hypothetical protein BZ136_08910 [Methanosphaera sp. rholeuAM74]|nr:MAG: hypothetical protein BZ136_08910 [Methanosphaera sp. rholeuAM74]
MSTFILPDSAFMPGVIPTYDQLEKERHATIQWLPQDKMLNAIHTAKSEDRKMEFISNVGDPFYHTQNGSIVKPGMLPAAEATAFLAERTYQSVFHQKCNYERIVAKRTKRAYYGVNETLESLTSVQNGKQRVRDDVKRDKHIHRDKVLVSEPYVETADFTREDLKNHLTGQRFLQEYINAVSGKREWNLGMLELYSIRDPSAADTDGLHANDGLFKQLDQQYTFMKENIEDSKSYEYGQGYYCGIYGTGTDKIPLDFSKMNKDATGNIVEQLIDMETQYYTQMGNSGQEFLVSPEAYGQLRKLAGHRETARGDQILLDGGVLRVNGTSITPCMELALPRNGYKQHVLLGNFKSGVTNGLREDFTTEINYDFDTFMWKVSTFVDLGTLLEREQDVLAAEVTNLPTQVAQQDGDDSP